MKYFRTAKYEDFYTQATAIERKSFMQYSWQKIANLPMKRNHKTIFECIVNEIKGERIKYKHNKKTLLEKEIEKIRGQIETLDGNIFLMKGNI